MGKSIFSVITNFIKGWKGGHSSNNSYDYIYYEIIDFDHEKHICTLRCINTLNQFSSAVSQIVFDVDILYFLHPVHACFIGIEYARFIKHSRDISQLNTNLSSRKDPVYRYGDYEVLYKDRKGNICFSQISNDNTFTMDPRDIVLSSELIQEFDASQAFYIGLEAGLKLDNTVDNQRYEAINSKFSKGPHLTLVK